MAGTFGHEASHIEESTGIYQLSWQQAISRYQPEQILATGYSCRSQVARFEDFKPKHPLQIFAWLKISLCIWLRPNSQTNELWLNLTIC